MDSLELTERECADGRTAPRVSLGDIEANIATKSFCLGRDLVEQPAPTAPSLDVLTICLLVLRNGFTIIGKSAPASAENFDEELGRKLAYEDAVRQVWPLMGYALREKLAGTPVEANRACSTLGGNEDYHRIRAIELATTPDRSIDDILRRAARIYDFIVPASR
ncbi:Gp49 family protein [Sphingomonas baiyangensis]|uniref:Uncharacterized protein n=1 Tax=Sphingomonas baiyangensis TaxID=2572576 RepID=A0A4V5PYC3_9SPHN|nr:Gp49 family protein [Sphingomonas baiyangensis]TKD50568.1 hypothetical protein FBR43_07165 [Sphingomonas baiyangensis]